MIGSLRGRLLAKHEAEVIVETGGVGYQLSVPVRTLAELPAPGKEVFLHVHTGVKEEAIHLYGFGTEGEKRLFLVLLGITGIGPRVAMNILSGISIDEFMRAVEAEDVAALTKVPGLGKKTASRLVLELKGKLPRGEGGPVDALYTDTLSALMNLGYRKAEAEEAVAAARRKGVEGLEPLLKEALRSLRAAGDR